MAHIITDLSKLNAAIKSIATRSAKLDQDIQVAALSCISRIAEHGDVRPLNNLRAALGKGHRANALDLWAFEFGKVVANTDSTTKKDAPYIYDKEGVVNLEGASAAPWYEFKPEQDPDQVFNVHAAVRAIIAKAGKKNVEDAAFLKSLQAFVAQAEEAEADTLNDIEE